MKARYLVVFCIALLGLGIAAQAVTIATVPVGNAGNTADTRVMNDGTTGYGSVAYNYNIGKYEVTAGQYTDFLNAVAGTDTYGLYNSEMSRTDCGSGITRSGSSGGFNYSVDAAFVNCPVNYVSYWDACRFANWLGNGQGIGSTETGAYTLDGYSGTDGRLIQRNAGATWAVTSEDEWYKAAYYTGGGLYSLYANGTSTVPDAGTDSNCGGAIGHTWDGTTYGALEQNGTKDMMGNVWEWNEAIVVQIQDRAYRGLRGGSGSSTSDYTFQASCRDGGAEPNYELGAYSPWIGFRVSEVPGGFVPEPSSFIALSACLIAMLGIRKHKS